MQQKLFQNFVTTRSWGFWKRNIEKELQKPRPQLKKYVYYIFTEYLLYLQSSARGSFLQKCINFVEQRLKYSQFKGSVIP